jgi:hypothetical protein
MINDYKRDGYVLRKSFFLREDIERVRHDAKNVFIAQMRARGILSHATPSEEEFESAMREYFASDMYGFVNCGKTCQHLVSLHRLSLSEAVMNELKLLGIQTPNICTRPVIYFNSRHLAKHEVYYKTPPHQDWRSMQGSLNAVVLWVPLVDVSVSLGALEIIPGSHRCGLQDSRQDEWFRSLEHTDDRQFVPVEVETGDALFFSAFLIHRSGNNVTDAIRWSCHFRYNDLAERTFIERKYPNPYIYKPEQELVTHGFPTSELIQEVFSL